METRKHRSRWALALGVAATVACGWDLPTRASGPAAGDLLRIYHIDIGQGDATVIVGPGEPDERKVMVVDSGDPLNSSDFDGGLRMLQALEKLGITHLDYVLLTHYDYDHIGGLVRGLGKEHSTLLGMDSAPGRAGVDDDGDGKSDWLDAKKSRPDPEEFGRGDDLVNSETQYIDRGTANADASAATKRYFTYAPFGQRYKVFRAERLGRTFQLGNDATATVVCGNGFVWGKAEPIPKADSENERSVGVVVTFKEFDYLICGDLIGQAAGAENANLEEPLADALLARDYKVEVIHVNHHGASNATRAEYVAKLKPTVGVISAGNGNSFKHPTIPTLRTLFDHGVAVFQTEFGINHQVGDRKSQVAEGHILLETDGAEFTLKNWGNLSDVEFERTFQVRQ